ncbi:hypothetical protein [Candidatus Binatus sp.]|uniref:hypothetical protein n=1 Tax=Candidatus Binatus sp. TaxID=2811406 RepID=UPI002F95F1B4
MGIASKVALAAAVLLIRAASLSAGTVQVGLLNDSDYGKWQCGPSMPPPKPSAESRCASAEFQKCSSCDTVAVTNNSDAPVEVKLEFSGAGFSEEDTSGTGSWGLGESPNGEERDCSKPDPCGHLLPGKRCAAEIRFCPEQSGASRGQVKVIIGKGGKSRTTTFDLVADASYSPELQAADEARRRHLDELTKIPHVAKVELDPTDDGIFINVEVEEDASLDKVRRAAPPKIEGYDVEVTRYMPVFIGY